MKIDYICIGMQRAGTTWLYKNFQENEKLRGFPFKEIHYFDNNISSSPNYKNLFSKNYS